MTAPLPTPALAGGVSFQTATALVAGLVLFAALPAPTRAASPKSFRVYVGTYSSDGSKGIYQVDFDPADGTLGAPALAAEAANPSFLALHPTGKFLYSANEIWGFGGGKGGAVSAFAVDPGTGKLTLLNQESTVGPGPCYVTVDAKGTHVLAANYGGGSACALPIGPDGRLSAASAFVQHAGTGTNPQRQEAPHAHSINLDKANKFAFVADLGLDKVLVYKYDQPKGTLSPNDPPAFALPPGSGPRHMAFHPNGKNAYVINELTCTVTAAAYDPDLGVLKAINTVSTLPAGTKLDGNSTAEVVVHPSGKFVYGSNRGHNSIAVFTVDPANGSLVYSGEQATGIKTPRNFTVDPRGRWLLVANQDGNSIIVFRIDPATGALTPTGAKAAVVHPVCLRLLAAR